MSSLLASASNALTSYAPTSLTESIISLQSSLTTTRSLLATSWSWMKDHKREVAGGVALTTAVTGYVLYRRYYPTIKQILTELESGIEMMRQLSAHSSQAQQKNIILIHRLEHNLTVGDLTLRQFIPSIRRDLCTRFDVDSVRARLKKGNGQEQANVWEEFKVLGISRTIAGIYTVALIHALVKLQVSIVSRYVLFDQQAQTLRAEQEAQMRGDPTSANPNAEGATNSSPASSSSSSASSQPSASQQPFLPPAQCEEINRLYFSLSTHACTLGASQLADAIAATIRTELLGQPVTTSLDHAGLRATIMRIRAKVESDVLGVEEKERAEEQQNEGETTTGMHSITDEEAVSRYSEREIAERLYQEEQRVTGSSSNSITFPPLPRTTSLFLRFLLPPPSALTTLVSSPSFPEQHLNSMSSFRLAEMIAETRSVMLTKAFQQLVVESTRVGMELLEKGVVAAVLPDIASSTGGSSSHAQVPLANVLVSIIKLFATLIPDVPASAANHPSAAASVSSPLYHALADLPAMKELAAVIYLPSEAITAPPQPGQLSTMQQITQNQQFAGNTLLAPPLTQNRPAIQQHRNTMQIEEEPATSTTAPASGQDVKGLPVFDRL